MLETPLLQYPQSNIQFIYLKVCADKCKQETSKSILYQLSVLPLCKELVNVNILSLLSLKRIHIDYLEIKCIWARWLWPDFLFYFWQFVYLWLAQCHLCLISVFYQWPLFDVWCLISKYLWKLPVLSPLLPVSEANFPMGFRKLPQQLPVRLYYSPCNTRATWPTATATCLNLFWSLIDPFDVVIWKRQRDLDISVREGIERYSLEGRKDP